MKIPSDPLMRWVFAKDILDKCLVSREERISNYRTFRQYLMYGCGLEANVSQVYNKIYPHLDQLAALMFSSETTKFACDVPPECSDLVYARVDPVKRSISKRWHAALMDTLFEQGLFWSFAYGSMFIKLRWNKGRIEGHLVEPHDFGVLREDVMGLHNQEAFVQCYWITKSQLREELAVHPRKEEILKRVIASPKQAEHSAWGVPRIAVASTQPTYAGNYDFALNIQNRYRPMVAEDLVQMHELYVWDDSEADYRVFTMAEPGEVVYDRPISKMNVVGREAPYVQICPNPAHDYFWGHSEVEKLMPLQDLRNARMEQIKHMMDLQANPPKSFAGFPGINDEIGAALDSPGGWVQTDMPGAKAEKLSPDIPQDLFMEIREIDLSFEEMSGITSVMQGQGAQGVRSDAHASRLANFGSTRAKKRALVVEDALDRIATLMLKTAAKFDGKTKLRAETGEEFILAQFDERVTMKVDAHSNSPIFVNDQRMVAGDLFKVAAIDRETLIELYDPPMPQTLIQRLKSKIIPQEQAAARAQAQQEAMAASEGKVTPLPRPAAGSA